MGFWSAHIQRYYMAQQLIVELRQRAIKRRGRINGGKLILSLSHFVV